ncbi:hypothetical protein ABBQ38_013261 [Trebouxia sp. C0009 RCD-2024]
MSRVRTVNDILHRVARRLRPVQSLPSEGRRAEGTATLTSHSIIVSCSSSEGVTEEDERSPADSVKSLPLEQQRLLRVANLQSFPIILSTSASGSDDEEDQSSQRNNTDDEACYAVVYEFWREVLRPCRPLQTESCIWCECGAGGGISRIYTRGDPTFEEELTQHLSSTHTVIEAACARIAVLMHSILVLEHAH